MIHIDVIQFLLGCMNWLYANQLRLSTGIFYALTKHCTDQVQCKLTAVVFQIEHVCSTRW